MQIKTRAIVLNSVKFGESQRIVDFLTEQSGRLSFICRQPKSARSRVRKSFFQPMTVVEITFDYRQRVRLQHIKEETIALPFASIPFEPYKLSISLFLAEFLYYATRSEQADLPLFNYVVNSLAWLDGAHKSFSNFHLVFMMRLSRFLGFYPNLDGYQEGDFFDLRNSIFTPEPPLHADFLCPDEAAKISLLMRMNYETMHLFAMSRAERNRCIELITAYYRLHLPNFPELNSLSVVRELFS